MEQNNKLVPLEIRKNIYESSVGKQNTQEQTTKNSNIGRQSDSSPAENKDSGLKIIGKTLGLTAEGVAKGVTHAIDKTVDFFPYMESTLDNIFRPNSPMAYISAKKQKEAQDTHLLGNSVKKFEEKHEEKQAQLLKDNPNSKLAKAGNFVSDLGESVGEMLPAIALAAATAGVGGAAVGGATAAAEATGGAVAAAQTAANAVNVASKVASYGSMFARVYSSTIDDQVAQGYDYQDASKNAFLKGALEVATESLTAGIPFLDGGESTGTITAVAKKIVDKNAAKAVENVGLKKAGVAVAQTLVNIGEATAKSTGFKKLLLNAGGEAFEEMVSEAVSPFIDRATTNPNASNATVNEILTSGLGGALCSFALAPLGKVQSTMAVSQRANSQDVIKQARQTNFLMNKELVVSTTTNMVNGEVVGNEQIAFSDNVFMTPELRTKVDARVAEIENGTFADTTVTNDTTADTTVTTDTTADTTVNQNATDVDVAARAEDELVTRLAKETIAAKQSGVKMYIQDQALRNKANQLIAEYDAIEKPTVDDGRKLCSELSTIFKEDSDNRIKVVEGKSAESEIRDTLVPKEASVIEAKSAVESAQAKLSAAEELYKSFNGKLTEVRTMEDGTKITGKKAKEALAVAQNELLSAQNALNEATATATNDIKSAMTRADAVAKYGQKLVDGYLAGQRERAASQNRMYVEDDSGVSHAYTKEEYAQSKYGTDYDALPTTQRAEVDTLYDNYMSNIRAEQDRLEVALNKTMEDNVARVGGKPLRVRFEDLSDGQNAYYKVGKIGEDPGEIVLNRKVVQTEGAANYFLSHEMLHAIKANYVSNTELQGMYEGLRSAMDWVGYDYGTMSALIYANYADTYRADAIKEANRLGYKEGSTKRNRFIQSRVMDMCSEEVYANFMSFAFGNKNIVSVLAHTNADVVKQAGEAIDLNSERIVDTVYDFVRLKALDNVARAVVAPETPDEMKAELQEAVSAEEDKLIEQMSDAELSNLVQMLKSRDSKIGTDFVDTMVEKAVAEYTEKGKQAESIKRTPEEMRNAIVDFRAEQIANDATETNLTEAEENALVDIAQLFANNSNTYLDDVIQALTESGKATEIVDKAENELSRRGYAEDENGQMKMFSKQLDDYWKPNLTKDEWSLATYAMKKFEGDDFNATKRFAFKSEKGNSVFVLYSTIEEENPTLLFATGGDSAIIANGILFSFKEETNGRDAKWGSNIDKSIKEHGYSVGGSVSNGTILGYTATASGDASVSQRTSRNRSDGATSYRQNGGNTSEYRALINALTDSKSKQYSKQLDAQSARMSDARIDYLIKDSGAGTKQNYAQKWITSISPTDFINLTTGNTIQERATFDTVRGDYGDTVETYDYVEGLKKETRQTPFLSIDENGTVVGHEGRHRMRALEKEGVQSADVVVQFYDTDGYLVKNKNEINGRLETIPSLVVTNQFGTGQTAEIANIIPFNEDHRAEIVENYGEKVAKDGDIRYSTTLDQGLNEAQLQEWADLSQRFGTHEYGSPAKLGKNVRNSQYADRVLFGTNDAGEAISAEEFAEAQKAEMLAETYARPVIRDKEMMNYATDMVSSIVNKAGNNTDAILALYNDALQRIAPKNATSKGFTQDLAYAQQVYFEMQKAINEINVSSDFADAEAKQIAKNDLFDKSQNLLANLTMWTNTASHVLQVAHLTNKMTPQGRIYRIQAAIDAMDADMSLRADKGGLINGNLYIRDAMDGKIKYRQSDGTYQTLELTEAQKEELLSCTSQEEVEQVEQEILQELASRIPPSLADRANAYRYLAMLGNPRTSIRNIASNTLMSGVSSLKDRLAGAIEDSMFGDTMAGRLHTNKGFTGEELTAFKDFIQEDFETLGRNLATNGGKYNNQTTIEQYRDKFGKSLLGKGLNKWDDLTTNGIKGAKSVFFQGLEGADIAFMSKAYQRAFLNYAASNGLTLEYLQSGTREANTDLSQARNFAVEQAQIDTFREANAIADILNKLEKQGGVVGFLSSAIVPFKKTPANILKRGIEYSPLGLLKSVRNFRKAVTSTNTIVQTDADGKLVKVTKDAYAQENYGKGYSSLDVEQKAAVDDAFTLYNYGVTDIANADDATIKQVRAEQTYAISKAIDNMAKKLTGTGLYIIGFLLARMGILHGSGPEDKTEKYYNEMTGTQEYSIDIGNHNITLDWLTPSSMTLFAGVESYSILEDVLEGDSPSITVSDAFKVLANVADPVTNMSFLQGFDSAIEKYDTEGIGGIVRSAVESYVGQYVPTLAGQIARTVDDTRRDSYAPNDTGLGANVSKFVNKIENKIPGLSTTNPAYVDMWGRTETSGGDNIFTRVFNNMIAPWYSRAKNTTDADNVVAYVFDATKSSSVLPTKASKNYTLDGETFYLTSEEYQLTQQAVGQMSATGISSLAYVDGFANLSADEQADIISEVYSFAKMSAKNDYYYAKGIKQGISTDELVRIMTGKDNSRTDADNALLNAAGLSTSDARTVALVAMGIPLGEAIYVTKYINARSDRGQEFGSDTYITRTGKEATVNYSQDAKIRAFLRARGWNETQVNIFSKYAQDMY